MRVEVEPRHEDHAVYAHLPLFLEHDFGISPECAGCDVLVTVLLGLEELLGFGETDSDESNAHRQSGSDPKDCLSGVTYKIDPRQREIHTFHVSTSPPTPRLAQAANT